MFETRDTGDLVAEPGRMSEEDILTMIGDVFDQQAEIRSRLEKRMPDVRTNVMNLFGEIGKERYGNRRNVSARNDESCMAGFMSGNLHKGTSGPEITDRDMV